MGSQLAWWANRLAVVMGISHHARIVLNVMALASVDYDVSQSKDTRNRAECYMKREKLALETETSGKPGNLTRPINELIDNKLIERVGSAYPGHTQVFRLRIAECMADESIGDALKLRYDLEHDPRRYKVFKAWVQRAKTGNVTL